MILLLGLVVLFLYSQKIGEDDSEWVVGIVMSVIMMTIVVTILALNLIGPYKYKQSIERLIKYYADTSETVSCNDSGITFSNAKEIIVSKWELVTQLRFTPMYIALYVGRDYHTLPRSAMTEREFETLGSYLKNKLGYLKDE